MLEESAIPSNKAEYYSMFLVVTFFVNESYLVNIYVKNNSYNAQTAKAAKEFILSTVLVVLKLFN